MNSSFSLICLLRAAMVAVFFLSAFASAEEMVFEEILVTAEKRSESLQDLSQAITVSGRYGSRRASTDIVC